MQIVLIVRSLTSVLVSTLQLCKAHSSVGLFEDSDPKILCACLDALVARVVPHALGESNCMCIYTDVITYLDVYQAALTRSSTPNVCRLYYIYIYIYIYIHIVFRFTSKNHNSLFHPYRNHQVI
jgi:hypothetical protein